MPKGIILPRSRAELPAELTRKGTDLDVLITLSGDGDGAKSVFGFASVVRSTRRLIKMSCQSYRPSRANGNEFNILCLSGELDGTPFRGEQCFQCRAAQFSAGGMFVGEIAGAELASADA